MVETQAVKADNWAQLQFVMMDFPEVTVQARWLNGSVRALGLETCHDPNPPVLQLRDDHILHRKERQRE